MSLKLKYYLYGAEIIVAECDIVPRKGDHLFWNGTILEVAMVIWAPEATVHLYLAKDPFNNPLPPGLEEPCETPPT